MGAHPEVVAMIRSSMASVVNRVGELRSLLPPPEPATELTDEQLTQPKALSRLLTTIIAAIARLERRANPRRIDYEDIEVNGDGVTVYALPHGMGGRVRWWVVDATDGGPAQLHRSEDSTDDVLYLLSEVPGTVTIRVEEVGG